MVLVVDDLDVVEGVVEQRLSRCQTQCRIRERVAGELLGDLLDMVVVDVAVAAGSHEVADLETGLRRHHVREQRVAGDVEGNAQKDVG